MNELERQEVDFERMLDGVTAWVANPEVPGGLEQRLATRVFAAAPRRNVLPFGAFATLDRVSGKAETRKTVWGAALLHAAVLALLFVQIRAMHERVMAPETVTSEVVLDAPTPPLPASDTMAHGGGGHAGPAPVTRGTPPPPAPRQIMPPDVPPVVDAKLPVMATVTALQMQMAPLPQVGVANAALSNNASLGNGHGTGVGPGGGDGVGPGLNGGTGGGLREVGGGVSAPVVLYAPEPEFSEEARKSKVSGNVLVYLQVDEQGRPAHVRVLRGIGLGLDEKAVEAVRQYRFKPARENGVPVRVEMDVEVTFNIY